MINSSGGKKKTGIKSKNYSNKIERAVGKKLKYDCALICLCVITILSNSAYALIAPFLPNKLAEKKIPLHMFGWIFCVYSIAVMIISPQVGLLLNRYRRRNFLQFGMFAMAIAMVAFALADFVDNFYGFLTICFISRIIQGFASSNI